MDYFVSYSVSNGFGRCRVTRETPITCIEDIEEMEAAVYRNQIEQGTFCTSGTKPIIVNWQPFEKPL